MNETEQRIQVIIRYLIARGYLIRSGRGQTK